MALVLLLAGASTVQAATIQRSNELYIPEMTYRAGSFVNVPIYMRNSDEVISAQFDIRLPYTIPADGTATLSARSDGHSASFSPVAGQSNTYRVVVTTFQNRPFRGSDGLLISLPMQTRAGTPSAISISDVVLTDRTGKNIATSRTGGVTPVATPEHLPDLTVTSVSVSPAQSGPGQTFTITYNVANIGDGPTRGGWTEKLYLQGSTGERLYVGSAYHSGTLDMNGVDQRTFTTTLPQVLHVDGYCHGVVEVVPTSATGELLVDRGNNTGISQNTVNIDKCLTLVTNKGTIYEGRTYGYATLTVTRSGDWTRSETFTVRADVQGLVTCNGLTLPCQVTIPARSAGTSLRIAAVDDRIVRAKQVRISIDSQNGYNALDVTLQRVDDDRNPLSLTVNPDPLTEGQTLTITAERGGELTDVLDLRASCSAAARFDRAFDFHFDAGARTSTLQAVAIDNAIVELDQTVRFSATATDYATASATLTLRDDDRPAITMTLSQPTVTENLELDDDALPLTATIRRDRGLDSEATIYLTSSRSEVYFENSRVTFPAGTATVEVPVYVTDNDAVDGARTATLTAALYVPSAGRTTAVGDRATATVTLTIQDDEQPYLTLSSRVSAVAEGGSATITVRRVQADVSAPATVSLSCDDARVSFQPTPVTIAAGSRTATASVRVARNSVSDDAADVLLRATAPQLGDAYLRMHITDRTLPDAVCTKIECIGPRFYSGLSTTFRATIRNYGTLTLPAGMTIDCYLAASKRYYLRDAVLVCQATTDRAIEPGDEAAFEFEAQLPQRVGYYYVWARVNANSAITELDYGNNLSRSFGAVSIKAPFEVSEVSVTPEDCLPGQVVTVSGRMTAVEEGLLGGQTVRVRLNGKGQNSYTDTRINAQGDFKVNVRVDRSAHGWLTVEALALGQTAAARTTRLHVYNQNLISSDGTRWVVNEGTTKQGYFTWVNTSAKPITISSFRITEPVPDGCTIRLTPPAGTIAAGQSVRINYSIEATKPTSEWQRFDAIATSAEGLQTTLSISYRCQATSSWLVFSPKRIRTTMLFGQNRSYAVSVTNQGLKATGQLSALAQDGWVLHDADRLSGLEPGATATIHFTFVASESKHSGRTYSSYFQLKPEVGPTAGLPIEITVTGHEYAHFGVRASDVYSLANGDYSHVAGATVTVRNARTGRTVHTGTLNAQGIWQTEQMEEGTYDITVRADRHVTMTQRIAVGPGEQREVSLLLPYRALVGHFVVNYDNDGQYHYMSQSLDIDSHAPQAIVKATIADRGFECGRDTVDIVLENVGSRTARRSRLTMPYVNGCTFTFLNDMPSVLEPGEKYILTMVYEGPEQGVRRTISTIRMYYEFDIDGRRLYEEDDYRALFGCSEAGGRPVIDPEPQCYGDNCDDDPDKPNPCTGDDCDDQPRPIPVPDTMDEPWQPLPTYGAYWMLKLDADSVRVGEQLGATLYVHNGIGTRLRNMRFLPEVADPDTYEFKSQLFQFAEGETAGFTTDGSYLQLAGNSEGSLRVMLTPLAEAAPDGRRQYLLGGQIQYTDPQTAMACAASLYDYVITVLPGQGEVELTYLIGRHFINDDQTTERHEPRTPGIYALLARAKGDTPFSRIDLTASLPKVVTNTEGQDAGLTAEWAGVDGTAGNYSFEDFGLRAGNPVTQMEARWLYSTQTSSHTVDIDAIAGQVQAVAGTGTRITINKPRELVRAVNASPLASPVDLSGETESDARVKAMTLGDAYLLNDIDDELSMPDIVLSASGEESDLVNASQTATLTETTTTGEYTLLVTTEAGGWKYVRLNDPTGGLMRLTKVTRRSDNATISPASFWQSELTPQADYSLMQENLIHLADKVEGSSEQYLLHFDERPGDPIRLMSTRLYTADGTEVHDGETTAKPVTRIDVELTGAIRNLTLNYVGLKALGRPEDLGSATLTNSSEKRHWTLDISALTPKAGEHSLYVRAYKFKGADGREVEGEQTITWTEALTTDVNVTVVVAPDSECGTVTPTSGTMAMGSHSFEAVPAKGYLFESWQDATTGQTLGTDPSLTLDLQTDSRIIAHFAPEYCDVTVVSDHGQVLGHTSGLFAYGYELQLAVEPDEGYTFSHWLRNGDHFSDDAIVTDIAKGSWTYTAVYVKSVDDGISGLTATDGPVDIYSLTGVRMRSAVTDVRQALRSLPAGIYIVGGQKVSKR